MDIKKSSLKNIFLKYLLGVSVSIGIMVVLLSAMSLGILIVAIGTGAVIPADDEEQVAFQLKAELEGKENLQASDFEGKCQYALFDKDYKLISSNLEEPSKALGYLKGNYGGDTYYISVEGKNAYGVIAYQLMARYRNAWLDRYVPGIEILLVGMVITGIILTVLLVSSWYGKRVTKALEPLKEAVQHLQSENLDFEIQQSEISEFDEIGSSIKEMQEALRTSLLTQWTLEKTKREQMAAIAHDIKTPLTIIKGSAELLGEEEEVSEEASVLLQHITRNSSRIEGYIKLLIELSHEGEGMQLNKKEMTVAQWIERVLTQAQPLAQLKNIQIDTQLPPESIHIQVDPQLMERAVLNIISNGIDYTPEGGKIILRIEKKGDGVVLHVLDEGIGFSSQSLKSCCEAFYMADGSRSKSGHYGMGLYIAKQMIHRHQGKLVVANREEHQGGKVSIWLPIKAQEKDSYYFKIKKEV